MLRARYVHEKAVAALRSAGRTDFDLLLLHAVPEYPDVPAHRSGYDAQSA